MAGRATSPAERLTGRCLCAAVRFAAAVPAREFGACHCGLCRRWTGGPFLAVECEGALKVEIPENLGVYRSSEWAERWFCAKCGTALFYRLVGKDFYAVSLETLDDRAGFVFTSQIFIDDKPPYYAFANATKTMTGAEVFAAFGASGGSDGQ
jgi:hypothetical protein